MKAQYDGDLLLRACAVVEKQPRKERAHLARSARPRFLLRFFARLHFREIQLLRRDARGASPLVPKGLRQKQA